MKLGLVTDIHESVELLDSALSRFRKEAVDQVVVIGDIFEMGERIEETCALLAAVDAVGVWGNHDFGLCVEPDDAIRRRYSPVVLDWMTSLHPRLEIEECCFTHVEPWLDPEKVEDLWYFDGVPDTPAKLNRIFNAGSHRLMFAGHFHQWLLATPDGITDWRGECRISLASGRYYAVIGALCDGYSAILDSATWELVPIRESHS